MVYNLYNLNIETPFEVDKYFDICKLRPSSDIDVHIVESSINFQQLSLSKDENYDLFSSKKYTEIYKRNIGKFVIENGRKITYEPTDEIKELNLIVYLLSNIFSYLLYQRGHIVLHAAAIAIDNKSYFFSGRSGVGKSTLVNNLLKAGNFLSEDTCCFDMKDKKYAILSSLPFIKLDSSDNCAEMLKSFPTQVDSRERVILSTQMIKADIPNEFRAGFFLKYGKIKKMEKISKTEAIKNFISNMRSSYPNDKFIEDQKENLIKISSLVENHEFFNVYRDSGENFDIEAVLKQLSI